MKGFLLRTASENLPPYIFMMFEVPSAMPSTRPKDAAPVFNTDMKNAGNTDATISEEMSLKKLVRERRKTFLGGR
ncbi:hypothetical protein HY090_00190 [Candidatus Kaiserbacteria bacterium]|nr:hypothetical protein [Candidatus Kaiserbacteria bacterium]